ncbi:MAG TPA: ACT domain-containing protein [Acidimicrobiia bacterium]|nr:ACT domain-containing protein [Acidimicrobiia bacterium]
MSAALRAARDGLVGDTSLRGVEFGRALTTLVDDALRDAASTLDASGQWALVAMGSYARGELCPGSDIDVMLLHAGGRRSTGLGDDASRLWYPLWDAGFVLGHSARTTKEALALADRDLDALTAMLDTRLVAGDGGLALDLAQRVRKLAPRRRGRLIDDLAGGAAARLEQPGPIAEMLAPNLKDGGGGLRDTQAPGWVGWALEPDGAVRDPWDTLVAQGYLRAGDVERIRAARDLLLDARVALHRVTGGRSDQLTLQEQDAVAALVGADDADAHLRALGAAARSVVWITGDMWTRLQSTERGPSGRATGERRLDDHIALRDGRVTVISGAVLDTALVLQLAARAAELRAPFDRDTLEAMASVEPIEWTPPARDAFLALLRAGRGAIAVFEALDHVGVLVRLLPEWERVRALPQRNAYHQFTVDRHSLEAVAESVAILDDDTDGGGFDRDVARRAPADVLTLAALLHDVGKGTPGDHSVVGVDIARSVATRIGLDDDATDQLLWLVRHHLLLADTATRRDLDDDATILRFAAEVGDSQRLDLLYALTLGDSLATGTAAWNRAKAALVRQLYSKADGLLAGGDIVGDARRADDVDALLARHAGLLAARETAVEWEQLDDDMLRCTVVAPDRTGLLATVAGTLALVGLDIGAASVVTEDDGGMAIERFIGQDRFGRLETDAERSDASAAIVAVVSGDVALDEQLRARARRYRRPTVHPDQREVRVVVDTEASAHSTVVEIHAPDDVGLLARVAAVFAELGFDVTKALVSTVGDRVVDVFYLRDGTGAKVSDALAVDSLRATVTARLTTEVTLA